MTAWASFLPVHAHEPSLSLWTVRSPRALAGLWGRWMEVGAEGVGSCLQGEGLCLWSQFFQASASRPSAPGGPAWMRVCRAPGQGHRPSCLGHTSWASVCMVPAPSASVVQGCTASENQLTSKQADVGNLKLSEQPLLWVMTLLQKDPVFIL